MKTLNLIAMDFGASNGRGVLGKFDGNKIVLEELHRFQNDYVRVNGILYWDTLDLYKQILKTLEIYAQKYGPTLDGISVDTWGVDYGLIDENGQICGMPISYRNSDNETMDKLWSNVIDRESLFERTGLAANNFNTIYQLYARKLRNDSALKTAKHLLLLPDLFLYMLSGEIGSEYTMSSTTQLLNPHTRDWDYDLIEKIGISKDIFLPVTGSGLVRGSLLPELASDIGINRAAVIATGGHDTGSAVAAVPSSGDAVFISSGTWSLIGIENSEAIITKEVFEANYSNEGSAQGGFRPLKNIMGLWIIQQLRRQWAKKGNDYSWNEIVKSAKDAEPFRSFIDPDHQSFFSTDKMEEAICEFCRETNQPEPQTVGDFARCVYESLALKYRWAIDRMQEISGKKIETLNIVGGGSQNKLLNQMTANAIARPVTAGPVEGASIGNLLMQAVALGELKDIHELRTVVRNSFEVEDYQPQNTEEWELAYEKFLKIAR